jgi:hypothetical protein
MKNRPSRFDGDVQVLPADSLRQWNDVRRDHGLAAGHDGMLSRVRFNRG